MHKKIDASHSRYCDLVNNVANGGAVLSLLFLCARVALVGIIGKAVGGEVTVTAGTLLVGQAAGTERSDRRQPAVEAMTACTALATAARLASAGAARFYKS